ncbi:hypothetical protein MMC30_002022 [Trapelia coarctata]|nr:hypothetical protein [Trapelia coarctata]
MSFAAKRFKRQSNKVKENVRLFRWAFCQLEALKNCLRPSDIRKVLSSLPKTLDETYARILLGIDESYREEAIIALQWLTFSARPLTIRELAEAVLVNPRINPPFDPEDRFPQLDDILKILSTLVTTDRVEQSSHPFHRVMWKNDKNIRLAHFSAKEYLISERRKPAEISLFCPTVSDTQHFLAKNCLLYMTYHASAARRSLSASERGLEEFPLLQYACQSWESHLKAIPALIEPSLINMVVKFLISESECTDWMNIWRPDFKAVMRGEIFGSPLYYACYLGLDWVVSALLDRNADVNAAGEFFGTALRAASVHGHKLIVERLLEAGAEVNAEGGWCGTALMAASIKGHEQVVKRLLESRANVNRSTEYYGTALQQACKQGYENIVELLLASGADLDTQDNRWGADVNVHWGKHGTALMAAAKAGHPAILQQLLQAGVDVNFRGGFGTALELASRVGNVPIVEQLSEFGADVNARGSDYTALQIASRRGYSAIVTMLLAAGAEVSDDLRKGGHEVVGSPRNPCEIEETCSVDAEFGSDVNEMEEGDEDKDAGPEFLLLGYPTSFISWHSM